MLAKFLMNIAPVLLVLFAGQLAAAEAGRIAFAAGEARVDQRPAVLGDSIQEGDQLTTGADGYIYIKTIDRGFLILRPSSSARIVAYHIDPAQPENNRFKIQLESGVARHISGESVKNARQNFRFNTPVGAIGVRGTDFTVFTDKEVSRIAVTSGGIVVSGFGGSCTPEGHGPCANSQSRELFATSGGQVLQLTRGQISPELLSGKGLSPDQSGPMRKDEPSGKNDGTADSMSLDTLKSARLSQLASATEERLLPQPVPQTILPPPLVTQQAPQINWGRWQPVLNQPAQIDIAKLPNTQRIVAMSGNYAIVQDQNAIWKPPAASAASFSLRQYQAVILDEKTNLYTAAKIENAQLNVNFTKSTFDTRFDLVNQGERFQRQAQGGITRDGKLAGDNQFSHPTNMAVEGVLSNDKELAANYLFQTRIDSQRVSTGATSWGK